MPRAHRYFLPNHVWHITHRCHKKEFLLKFARDRGNWIKWLFEARKRFGLEILNYVVTSNHIHLLVYGDEQRDVIPQSMQLVAGRTGQAYNTRKKRKGAFWEDRYHAAAVGTDSHLVRCLIYIDCNMVRAGVVDHPAQCAHGGYREILNPGRRYRIIARNRLGSLLGLKQNEDLSSTYAGWIKTALSERCSRQPCWSNSIAVGNHEFVGQLRERLTGRLAKRNIYKALPTEHSTINQTINQSKVPQKDATPLPGHDVQDLPRLTSSCMLKERHSSYSACLEGKMAVLSGENGLFWDLYINISNS